jgi:hypothetical protein
MPAWLLVLWAGELHWTPEQQTRAADATVSALARMELAESGKAVGGAGEGRVDQRDCLVTQVEDELGLPIMIRQQ